MLSPISLWSDSSFEANTQHGFCDVFAEAVEVIKTTRMPCSTLSIATW